MSAPYRDMPRWAKNALRENEIKLFTRLQACARLCERFVQYTGKHMDAQEAALAAGADEIEVLTGMRGLREASEKEAAREKLEARPEMAGPGAAANSAPSAPEPVEEQEASVLAAANAPEPVGTSAPPDTGARATTPDATEKPRKRPYVPRFYAPPMLVLGWRAIRLLEKLAPMVRDQYHHLLSCGIDVRRLTLEGDDAEVAALLLDELGVQYHEIGKTDYERIRETIDRMEAWVRQREAGRDERKRGAADASPEEGEAGVAPASSGSTPISEANDPEAKASGIFSPDSGEKKPASPEPACPELVEGVEGDSTRPPAPYSGSGASLDWTKL